MCNACGELPDRGQPVHMDELPLKVRPLALSVLSFDDQRYLPGHGGDPLRFLAEKRTGRKLRPLIDPAPCGEHRAASTQ